MYLLFTQLFLRYRSVHDKTSADGFGVSILPIDGNSDVCVSATVSILSEQFVRPALQATSLVVHTWSDSSNDVHLICERALGEYQVGQ